MMYNTRKKRISIRQQLDKLRGKMSDCLQLESFPNEIFFEIFNYFSLTELYRTFKDLNQRLNHLLQSLNNRALELWSTNENAAHEMRQFFSPTIISLVINDDYNLHLNQYPKIRALTYIYATDDQLDHLVQSNFCHQTLKYLNVTSDDLSSFIEHIRFNQFSSLCQCTLRNIDSLFMSPWKINPTTRSISTCAADNLIPTILQSCPNLKSLSLSIYHYSNISLIAAITHRYLKDLSIELVGPAWTVEMIERLFSSIQIPHLISFQIRSYEPSAMPFDFNQLLSIFNTHLLNFERFECDLLFSQELEIIDVKSIQNLHPFLFTRIHLQYQYNGLRRIYTHHLEN